MRLTAHTYECAVCRQQFWGWRLGWLRIAFQIAERM
jgi:hypothetical protein